VSPQVEGLAVVIRIDDVQDLERGHPFEKAQRRVLQYHIEQRIPALVAIITSRFGTDGELLHILKRGLDAGVFTAAIHGWHHAPLTDMSPEELLTQLRMAREKLELLLGAEVKALVPPFSRYDGATIDAMKKTNLTIISGSIFENDTPRLESGILYIPETVSTAEVDTKSNSWIAHSLGSIMAQTEESWKRFGAVTVVVHARQFLGPSQVWDEARWDLYIRMIELIRSNGGKIIRAEDARPTGTKNSNLTWLLIGSFSVAIPMLVLLSRFKSKVREGRQSCHSIWRCGVTMV